MLGKVTNYKVRKRKCENFHIKRGDITRVEGGGAMTLLRKFPHFFPSYFEALPYLCTGGRGRDTGSM